MSYRVFWSPPADEKLRKMVGSDINRAAIASAARKIDRKLIASPATFGESRFDAFRIGFVHPLAVQFEILNDVTTVIVHDVWRTDRK